MIQCEFCNVVKCKCNLFFSQAFQKARALSPAILFFDEIESLVGSRSSGSSQSKVQERILSTMLNEMDGVGVRLDKKMDAALARQGESVDQKMIGENKCSYNVNHAFSWYKS